MGRNAPKSPPLLTQVRRCDHLRVIDELPSGVGFRGLLRVHVDGGPTTLATLEGRHQGGLIDDATPGDVNHPHALPALGKGSG